MQPIQKSSSSSNSISSIVVVVVVVELLQYSSSSNIFVCFNHKHKTQYSDEAKCGDKFK